MDDKTRSKLDKKKIKEESKVKKKQIKFEREKAKPERGLNRIHKSRGNSNGSVSQKSEEKQPVIQVVEPKEAERPWYKNPSWIRAIAGVVTMIIVLITFILTYK